MMRFEINYDGLVGPSHHYAGLAVGNMASMQHAHIVSHPKAAALQGLDKMSLLMDLGMVQAIMPPHPRPQLTWLRSLGFSGSHAEIIDQAWRQHPALLSACYSAASMWTANCATVSPSADTRDGKVHFTPANLLSQLHRAMEADFSYQLLQRLFSNSNYFVVHPPLPSAIVLADEGAANHNRLCLSDGSRSVEIFVYGKSLNTVESIPLRFPARQTRESQEAIARCHQLQMENTLFIQQNPQAIDAGVFHNDVISLAHEQHFFYHEQAFVDSKLFVQILKKTIQFPVNLIDVKSTDLSLDDVVKTYLFNSQWVRSGDATYFIAPQECADHAAVRSYIENKLIPQGNLSAVYYVNTKESMQNGGGPACLRLRVCLTEAEKSAAHEGVILTKEKMAALRVWVNEYYRESLTFNDLRDPNLIAEIAAALKALEPILDLSGLYDGWFASL